MAWLRINNDTCLLLYIIHVTHPLRLLTMRTLAGFFFGGLKRTDRNNISKDCFRIDGKILSSWIHTLVYIRNLCAHHSRIWNRILAIKPRVPNKLAGWKGISNSKIFCLFLIFKRLIILPGE